MTPEKQPLLADLPSDGRSSNKFTLVIHGGAGTMERSKATPGIQARYKAALRGALLAGYEVLQHGGEAMDAAVAAVSFMEDCPLFNSGRGAVFNVEGKNELETSLMLSTPPASHPHIPPSRRGASVTLLHHPRNPSHLARALYLSPSTAPHTMFSGDPAEKLGKQLGVKMESERYFWTEPRWREHRRGLGLPEEPLPYPPENGECEGDKQELLDVLPTGTVGAVALDVRGCIASCTSTGGRTNKLAGRVGDTPIMGAGFWAEEWKVKGVLRKTWRRIRGKGTNVAVGVSGTGDGDYFIRLATASTIGRRMRYLREGVETAAHHCVEELRRDGGIGGVIALDNQGTVAMPLNCSGMYRGVVREDGVPKTAIFDDDDLE